MAETAKLIIDGKEYEFDVIEGSEGERAIDISKLRAQTGYITMDPGYANTGSCQSSITFIDGEKGILRYRGYPIDQLASQSSFLETSLLVLKGELPSADELAAFEDEITYHTLLHEDMRHMYQAFPLNAHPMAVVSSLVGSLATTYQNEIDPLNPEHVQIQVRRLIAKLPTICAWAYKYSTGHPFVYPRNDLGYAANLLHMFFATPAAPYEPDPALVRAIDTLLILHADHEQNCSTSSMRLVGSSNSNLFASASAAIGALWGPLHGGANQAVIEMLEEIHSQGLDGKQYLEKVKKDPDTRLMGFGHRVYKNYDPRASVLKEMTREVLKALGRSTPLLDIAMQLEEVALEDEYFVKRKLYPNVDFYSGIIYQALGIPVNMFTVMFALGRMPGWVAQWIEMHADPHKRIGRPRQVYTGANIRDYVPMKSR
ncbi:citrate (Si)-synthase [bacterium]|nr:MAG: citrate (Si)-synthase [bacterium]